MTEIDRAIVAWNRVRVPLTQYEERRQREDYACDRFRVREWARQWAAEYTASGDPATAAEEETP